MSKISVSTGKKTGELAMGKISKIKILGFPLYMLLPMAIIVGVIAAQGILLDNIIGALLFAIIFGGIVGWIGDNIPIWKDWCGGGMLFTSLAAGALYTFKLVPESVITTVSNFNGKMGFLDFYIVVLLTGSVLVVDRKLLIRAFAGFIPTILGGVVVSFGLAALVGTIVGVGPVEAILNTALPIIGGGNGAGVIPMSKIWGGITGKDPAIWYAPAFATIVIGNLMAVVGGALLDRLGKKYPNITGEGQLIRGHNQEAVSKGNEEIKVGMTEYASGLALALFMFVLAGFYADKFSIINHLGLGFTIHKYAFMVIFCGLLNVSNIVPAEIRAGSKGVQQFFVKHMSLPLMVTVGITLNLADFATVFSFQKIAISLAVVIGSIIGTIVVGRWFKFYPVEAAITAGLCMANGGGSGDVQVLGASHRMELMPFAQISSRIGGAIILVIASILFGLFAS
ncbi:2-hydroxycarboxylate transporter family protein [Petroclostridium sp. X23]|uniref:2-hydroxycarboxylate transporter family protein n=1 Tax=Petroclostridium sp. X23 TaxID=3045146 RepID=UPI0024AD3EA1|nr:2-hydroxycarboxylate transporter family protein [Petroclostridium sp. X23]WHH59086.1 2-hydroxycarboxylate transporter family protein [Petroclostridium sp. X23]